MLDRRGFLTSAIAALGASGITRWDDLAAFGQPAVKSQRIDIHHHFAPPAWVSTRA